MKNLLLILFVAALAPVGFGQNKQPIELGIGFALSANPYKFDDGSHYNRFYSDTELKTEWKNGKIYPFFYKPDYGLYHFICVGKTDKYYKILINDSTIAYTPIDTNFIFKSWESIVINSTFERLKKENLIFSEPDTKSNVINNDCKFDRLKVEDLIEKNGEYWAYVSFASDCQIYLDNSKSIKHGWVRWRNKKELLVEILLLC